ncbi:hypothetical protein [Ramlibacter sp.]|uniref:hypothetical protein n=1 Tax=Ramlibacter sp. TaxID=1917967 RepID=UPI003D14009C
MRIVLRGESAGGAGGNVPWVPTNPPEQDGNAPSPPPNRWPGVCTSGTRSSGGGTQVRVVCSSGQYVNIQPAPGFDSASLRTRAFRYEFGPETAEQSFDDGPELSAGSVTGVHMSNIDDSDGPVQMVVSF